MIKKLLFACTFLMFVTAANSQNNLASQKIGKWKIEDVVKSFSAKNDTVYVVNFWATFCKPCIAEIPDFIRIVDKYKKQKVKLLLVSLDLPSYYPAKIAAFAKKNNYKTNIVWLNETNADHFCPMIDAKWSGAIPSTIIVNNKNGYKKFTEDQITPEDFEKFIQEAIGGQAMKKYVAPMNDAEVDDDRTQRSAAYVSKEYVIFKSIDSSVYAVTGGRVSMIAKIDGIKVVIVEQDKLFYSYSNLSSTLIKKGDIVKPNQLIGYAAFDLDGNKPTVEFYVSDAEKNIILTKANFAKRTDKKLIDHSIDLNLQEPQ